MKERDRCKAHMAFNFFSARSLRLSGTISAILSQFNALNLYPANDGSTPNCPELDKFSARMRTTVRR